MPLSEKGSKILASMVEQYGVKKGKQVFYASINKGKIKGAEGKGKSHATKKAKGWWKKRG
jgi:hypothetical protein